MRHAELVILGLLASRPRHGYELVREIETMQVRQWAKIGASTVYVALERLEGHGYLESSVDRAGNRPQRSVYTLTDRGRRRLAELARRALASDAPVYSDRLVGAVFAPLALGEPAARNALTAARDARERVSGRLAQARSEASPVGRAVIDYQRAVSEAEERLLERLAEASESGARGDGDVPEVDARPEVD